MLEAKTFHKKRSHSKRHLALILLVIFCKVFIKKKNSKQKKKKTKKKAPVQKKKKKDFKNKICKNIKQICWLPFII